MKVYKSNKFKDAALYPLIGSVLCIATLGIIFNLFYDFFFNHEDWVNARRLNKFLTGNDCYKIQRYYLDSNSNGYLDVFITTKLKLSISKNKWSLWLTNGGNSLKDDLIMTDQYLSYNMKRIIRKIDHKISIMILDYYDSIENKNKYKCKHFIRTGVLIDTFCKLDICNKSLNINFDDSCYCISGNIYVDWTKDIILKDKLNLLSK